MISPKNLVISGFAATIAFCLLSCSTTLKGQTAHERSYVWERVVEPGRGCFEEDCTGDKWPMAITPIVAFENKLFLIGRRSVWISHDGITWQRRNKTDWGERHGMAFAFFDNKLWMIGGMSSWDRFFQDAWYSTDGVDWKQATHRASFPPRRNHVTLVFDNRMWLIGGAQSSGMANKTPTRFYNDVWRSEDGIRWTQVTANASWPARDAVHALVYDGKIWIIGGEGKRDVWASRNGRDWDQVIASAAWPERRGAGVLVFDDRLWLFGGLETNDVWSSSDGKNWKMALAGAPWSTRGSEYSVVFRDRLWIFGGKTGRPDSWNESGDIWTMKVRGNM